MAYWLDDGFDRWPQVVRAGSAAVGLYVRCGAWISGGIYDGTVTEPVVPAEIAAMYGTPEWVAKLIAVGLWTTEGAGYRDVCYHKMGNPTAEKVTTRRKSNARRQALVRDPALREAVRLRDKDKCRYCGIGVRWNDRKGPKGGTYDHVDPDGPNSPENLVVCCRACNSRKRDRTPAEAGMPLIQEPGSYLDTTQVGSGSDPVSCLPHPIPPLKRGWGAPALRDGAARPPQHPPASSTAEHDQEPPPSDLDDPAFRAALAADLERQRLAAEAAREQAARTAHAGAALARELIRTNRARHRADPGDDPPADDPAWEQPTQHLRIIQGGQTA